MLSLAAQSTVLYISYLGNLYKNLVRQGCVLSTEFIFHLSTMLGTDRFNKTGSIWFPVRVLNSFSPSTKDVNVSVLWVVTKWTMHS